jgi:putative DNA primase/helicase
MFQQDSDLKDLIAFNETFQNIQFLKTFDLCQRDSYLEDKHESFLLYYLTTKLDKKVSKQEMGDALNVISHRHVLNPIKDWLNSLDEWDKVPRLGTWLHKYAGTEFNEYTGMVGKIALTASVARIFEPGIKFDSILILEGVQGSGKSTLVETLGGNWYLDMALKESDKDIIDEMRGCWIVEMSELSGFNKKEVDWLKGFLSRKVDRCRLSYGRRSQDFPRQVIFIGTMNPSGDNSYMRDDTGNRRFWPVSCGAIDIPGLKLVREKLFAEAISLYKQGYPLYLQGEALKSAEKEQAKREVIDPWHINIIKFVQFKEETTMPEILKDGLGINPGQQTNTDASRAGKILRKIGWYKHQIADGTRVYTKNEVKSQGRYASKQEEVAWSEEIIKT